MGYSPGGRKESDSTEQLVRIQAAVVVSVGIIDRETQETLGDHCKLVIIQEGLRISWKETGLVNYKTINKSMRYASDH